MMEGMKKQMVMMIPQTIIMGWINFFFSGFVLRKFRICPQLLICRSSAERLTHFFALLLTWDDSQTSFPLDAAIQGHAPARHSNS